MICPFKKIGELLCCSLESEHIFDNQYMNVPTISPNPIVGASLVSARYDERLFATWVPTRDTPTIAMTPLLNKPLRFLSYLT